MKKCRVTLPDLDKKTKHLYLLPDSSAVHEICKKSTDGRTLRKLFREHPETEIVTLKKGQWIEAEWGGCHISYASRDPISASFFRLIKATSFKKSFEDSSLISIHFGWMLSDHLRMCEGYFNGLIVNMLEKDDEQYEFSELFQDNETIEDLTKKVDLEKIV